MEMFIEISNQNPDFAEDDIINEICTFMLAVRTYVNFTRINNFNTKKQFRRDKIQLEAP